VHNSNTQTSDELARINSSNLNQDICAILSAGTSTKLSKSL
jgi:hypothetical protein